MKILQLGKGVAKAYRNTVRGNKNTSHEQIQRKLTRNVALSRTFPPLEGNPAILHVYGRLQMLVVGNRIVWVKNGGHTPKGWRFDKQKYANLSKKLGVIK